MPPLLLSPALRRACATVRATVRATVPGRDPASAVELAKLALADAVLAAVDERGELPRRARPVKVLDARVSRGRTRRSG